MPEEIVFTIGKDGAVKVEANGFVGEACKEATDAFQRALGGEVLLGENKPEIYQSYLPGTVGNYNG